MAFDFNNCKKRELVQWKDYIVCSNGRFQISSDMEIRMVLKREPDEIKLSELQNEIDATERDLQNSIDKCEIDELKSKLYDLETQFNNESQLEYVAPYICRFDEKENYLLDMFFDYTKDAKKDTVKSVAYATWRRDARNEPNENDILPDKWQRIYTWKKA